MEKLWNRMTLLFIVALFAVSGVQAQTTEFAYQGRLNDGGSAANGNYDFEFRLYNLLSGGTQIGPVNTGSSVVVANGSFSVVLDFGTSFPGADRFLEIRLRLTGQPTFTTLTPRQEVLSSPQSQKTLTADTAINSITLGGVPVTGFVQTNDPALTNDRNPLPGSNNYIQNSGAGQPGAGFNIGGSGNINGGLSVAQTSGSFAVGGNSFMSGNLTVNGTLTANLPSGDADYVQNRTTQQAASNFNISGAGTLGGALTANSASFTNTASANIFSAATQFNLGGFRFLSNPGTQNTFAGANTGPVNTGSDNSFFGFNAGNDNTIGVDNVFMGADAGGVNTSGDENTFVGSDTGDSNTLGDENTFVGRSAGTANTEGNSNTFIGWNAGAINTTGDRNTAIGSGANVGPNVNNATAIGAGASSVVSNTITLGRNTAEDRVLIWGPLDLVNLGVAGGTALCRNADSIVSTCSSSIRYKKNVAPLALGLDLVRRLRPITFDWKDGGMHDLGLGAEDVEKIEPLLVTYNKTGQIEGVKYDRIGVVLVNAVNEQQTQIEALEKQKEAQQTLLDQQQRQIESLMKLICPLNKDAEVCKQP